MKRNIIISSAALGVLAAVLCFTSQNSPDPQSDSSSPPPAAGLGKYVDKDGAIRLPEDYRLKWIHLGSWFVEGESGMMQDKDKNGGKGEMHDVYTEPESVAAFRNTGKFPPGATLVKEIR